MVVLRCLLVFFFKQKTAYEMRISDWSSDVCSSDLGAAIFVRRGELAIAIGADGEDELLAARQLGEAFSGHCGGAFLLGLPRSEAQEIGSASGRDRVCQYV